MKIIHTHRGHCQLCTMVQAIDPTTGAIALHGYTVSQNGYFVGTCPGSNHKSLHADRTRADKSIADARAEAVRMKHEADELYRGNVTPARAWDGTYHDVPAPTESRPKATRPERTMIAFADATVEQQRRQVTQEINDRLDRANRCTAYANDLEAWANKITGKVETYQVRDLEPRAWEVGDEARFFGKGPDGFTAKIEAIEEQEYRVNSFRRGFGSVMAKHARVTRPARAEKRVSEKAGGYVTQEARPAKVLWFALREMKRPPSPLAAMLKKEGKL
jgi:hypothetical protein